MEHLELFGLAGDQIEVLCSDASTPGEVLIEIFKEGRDRVKSLVLSNPSTPLPFLYDIYQKGVGLAKNGSVPFFQFSTLMESLGRNPRLPADFMLRAVKEGNPYIARGLVENRNVTEEVLELLSFSLDG